jgi:hypothetical protein
VHILLLLPLLLQPPSISSTSSPPYYFLSRVRQPAAAVAAQEGLEIAKLRISSKIVDWLDSKGITKLFPVQVTRSGGSSPIFQSKMKHIPVESCS